MATSVLTNLRLTPEALMDSLSEALDGVMILNSNRNVIFYNKAAERMLGYGRDEVTGEATFCYQLFQCQDEQGRPLTGKSCVGSQIFDGSVNGARQRVLLKRKDGRRTWAEVVFTPLKDSAGKLELVLAVMRDINSAKHREDEIRESAEVIRKQLQQYQAELTQKYGFDQIVASSESMQAALDKARAACQSDLPMLIAGEAGTGKTTVAKMVHYHGARQNQPFITGSCSAIEPSALETTLFGSSSHARGAPAGWLNEAAGGTLYLQDVDTLPARLQLMLAQAIQNRTNAADNGEKKMPDVRIVASTRHGTDMAMYDGALRPELLYAINVIHVSLPPLRERTEDIPLLVQHFIDRCNRMGARQVKHIAPRAWSLLLAYDWPGNVRELQHAVESTYALGKGDTLRAEDLPGTIRGEELALPGIDETIPATSLDEILEHAERRAILAALRRARGRRNLAAKLMGISRSRLYRRMEALNIVPPKGKQ
jgi:arginine utilization regulatory protein